MAVEVLDDEVRGGLQGFWDFYHAFYLVREKKRKKKNSWTREKGRNKKNKRKIIEPERDTKVEDKFILEKIKIINRKYGHNYKKVCYV